MAACIFTDQNLYTGVNKLYNMTKDGTARFLSIILCEAFFAVDRSDGGWIR